MGRRYETGFALLLLALACGCGKPKDAPAGDNAAFVENAEKAGISFRMEFLRGEQGSNFKINFYDHGCGVACGDIDGDGDDDLYFLNELGPNALYRNNGNGTFADVTAQAGVALGDRVCVSAAFNDVDNDGDEDLFVTSTRGGNVLFRNDGKGKFADATKEAGLTWVGHSQGATFFDADADGDLDLYVSNTAKWTTDVYEPIGKYYAGASTIMQLIESTVEENVFFRNNGDGTFANATDEAGLAGVGWGGDCAIFDYDDDGDQDVFLSNMFGGSILYRNDGKGRFEDVTATVLGKTPWGAVGTKVFDYDGDGRLDLYVVDMHSDMWAIFRYPLSKVEERKKYPKFWGQIYEEDPKFDRHMEEVFAEKARIPYDTTFFGNGLYRNLGGGKFEEVSDKTGAETFWPWGVTNGDYDNDGDEDVVLASGMGFPWEYWPAITYLRNNGDGTFSQAAKEVGLDPPPGGPLLGLTMRHGDKDIDSTKSSRSVVSADFDGDGRLDVAANNFNDRAWLFFNRQGKRNHIAFRLAGTRSNRDAVGAVVKIQAGGRTRIGLVQAAGGYLGQSSKTVHFGLGDATKVDSCEIRWPSGRVQVVPHPEANRIHKIEEPKE